MFSDNDIEFFKENGYIIKKILKENECDEINNYVENNEKNAYYELLDNRIKFGYYHKEDEDSPVNYLIRRNKIIHELGKKILDDYDFSVIRSYYKNSFIARDIEFHQEYFYNALHPTRENPYDYIQIFTALEDHNIENACLKIIPKTHKEGILPNIHFINSNLEHKISVKYDSLVECYKKYGIINCQLKKGESIIFNHLIVHGSQNNNSPFTRKALVTTIYKKGLELNEQKKKEFIKHRKEFTKKFLQDKIDSLLEEKEY